MTWLSQGNSPLIELQSLKPYMRALSPREKRHGPQYQRHFMKLRRDTLERPEPLTSINISPAEQSTRVGQLVGFAGSVRGHPNIAKECRSDLGDGSSIGCMLTAQLTHADNGDYTVTLIVSDFVDPRKTRRTHPSQSE
jgi:hypothetical protein